MPNSDAWVDALLRQPSILPGFSSQRPCPLIMSMRGAAAASVNERHTSALLKRCVRHEYRLA